MAKQNVRTLSQIVPVASVAWFKDTNRARPTGDYGKLDQLRNSMVERGWLMDDNGTLKVEVMPDPLKDRAEKERKDRWDTLKAAASADSNKLVDLKTFEEIYTDGKGKLLPVEYLGISGNRRSEVFFPAMVERKKENQDLTKEIPVIVCTFTNAVDRLKAQIDENEMKALGFMDMTDVDRLLSAKELVELGATQADLRRAFKDGTGQKLWGVITLDKRFPALGIISRMRKGPEEEGFIRLSSVKFSDLPTLVLRTDPKALAEKNQQLKTGGKEEIKPAVEADIEAYFSGPKPEGNKDKIMKRENIEQMGESSVKPLALVAKAIIGNNTDVVKHYLPFALGFNAFDDLILAGDGPFAEMILTRLARTPKDKRGDVAKAVKEVLDKAGV